MICRFWRGWTTPADADGYEACLREQLLPRLRAELRERGYRGFDLLRRQAPVISQTARTLLSHYDNRATHYELRAAVGSKGLESDAVLRGEAG